MSVRDEDRIWMAPTSVQKERLERHHLFELDLEGRIVGHPGEPLRISACAPLFMNAYRLRGAGAVIHSHSIHAVMATMVFSSELRVTHLEAMKGIRGVGYHDVHAVPIIANTAHESDLAEDMARAMDAYPLSDAVLVKRHGAYVWGQDWVEAKTQAECYHFLFDAAVRMRGLGMDPAEPPEPPKR